MEDYQLPAQTEYKGDLELQQEIADEQAQLEVKLPKQVQNRKKILGLTV